MNFYIHKWRNDTQYIPSSDNEKEKKMEQISARNCKIPNHVFLIDYRTFFLP